ncbi:outer membrane channel protein [Alteromonas sp. KUL42]|uniref:outer membrane channel protein TolC n=1 Tax=Alteromonas sp. KUL42 TaxID=2480797 RepID=UPI000796823B|nr:outer membrane channel protein TolC [Alteromonas sp. KUL42]KXJ61090.1 MAG: outer membrane channel protein [Alteromonas sp. Nap_26]TAP32265.1 outer membrane channel protein TolC [Alteromonas sp. KUL42]GEA08891.1 outer membrane channel protein [Alteromonas sp. KUL42]
MKRTLLSLVVGISMTTSALADDLMQVYQQALANDPVVNQAKAQRDAAFEGINISRAALLPQVSAFVSYTDVDATTASNGVPQTNEDGELVGFTFPLLDIDRTTLQKGIEATLSIYDHTNWVNLGRAEKVAQQSDSQYALQVQDLITRTVTAYLGVLRAKDSLEFIKAEKRAIERQLEQTKQRFEVGLTAITDVHEAQANFDNTVAREIQAENDVEIALEDLRVITGKYHSNLSVLSTERFSATLPQPQTVDEWLKIAEERNLSLMVQRLGKDIAEDDIAAARAGHYPTATFNAQYTKDDVDQTIGTSPSASLPTQDTLRLSAQITVPIYQGGQVSARTTQARHNYVLASEQLEQAHRQTVQSVRRSFNDLRASVSRIRALEQSVVSAESALKATEAGFDVGTRTIVDVLDSTRNLFDAQRNLAGARYDFIQSVVTLKQAAGTLTGEGIETINRGLIAAK